MIYHRLVIILIVGCAPLHAAEFVGTSPCGAAVREFIGVSKTEPCDKITWHLNLVPDGNTLILDASYGLQEQSAPGFVDGGKRVTFKGAFKITGPFPKQTYTIKTDGSDRALSILRVNDNLLQFLGPDGKLLVGNEFWSYTLNRKDAGKNR
jgi:hypothetical protein